MKGCVILMSDTRRQQRPFLSESIKMNSPALEINKLSLKVTQFTTNVKFPLALYQDTRYKTLPIVNILKTHLELLEPFFWTTSPKSIAQRSQLSQSVASYNVSPLYLSALCCSSFNTWILPPPHPDRQRLQLRFRTITFYPFKVNGYYLYHHYFQ